MSISQTAPSPFAALLRRSKFASYDPSIGQIYTTHGGHAYRGNWGLKRPLPNRRRTGFIVVRSVDSREQQTEWNSAEHSARWMRRWEELGKKLETKELGSWQTKTGPTSWTIDTEFDRAGRQGLRPSREQEREDNVFMDARNAVPNPDAMSPKQFRKYLDRLRELRPEFKTFLKERWEEKERNRKGPRLPSEVEAIRFTGSGEVDMFLSAQFPPETYITDFLKLRAKRDYHSPQSKRIEQRPHVFAGLEYTQMSALQSQYLHKPAPGRDIGQNRASRYEGGQEKIKLDLIAVGSIIGALHGQRGGQFIVPTDFGTRDDPRMDKERGKGMFRMSKVHLQSAPTTVGRMPQSINMAELRDIQFRMVQTANRSNPYPLGSAEYVAHEGITGSKGGRPVPQRMVSMTRHVPRPEGNTGEQGTKLLSKLSVMVEPKSTST